MELLQECFVDCDNKDYAYIFNLLFTIKDYNKCLAIVDLMSYKLSFHLDKHLRYKFAYCLKQIVYNKKMVFLHMKQLYDKDHARLQKLKKEVKEKEKQRSLFDDKGDQGAHESSIEKEKLERCLSHFKEKLNKANEDVKEFCDNQVNFIDINIFNKFPVDLKEISQCEEKVFYYKLKADLYRYKLDLYEFKEDRIDTLGKCENLYKNGIDLANKWELDNTLSLSIQCNYCVFLYEDKGEKDEAIEYLTAILNKINESILKEGEIEFANKKDKEYMKVLHLIKQNIFLWSNDMSEYTKGQFEERGYEKEMLH